MRSSAAKLGNPGPPGNLSVQIQNNVGSGMWIHQNSSANFFGGTSISGNNAHGLYITQNSMLYGGYVTVQNNGGFGVMADDSITTIDNSTISGNSAGDVQLRFGSRSTLNGNTIFSLPISCDGTVLSRGTNVCP